MPPRGAFGVFDEVNYSPFLQWMHTLQGVIRKLRNLVHKRLEIQKDERKGKKRQPRGNAGLGPALECARAITGTTRWPFKFEKVCMPGGAGIKVRVQYPPPHHPLPSPARFR